MTQYVARWHSSSKKMKMSIFVRISVMIRQHLAFGRVGPSCLHFLPTYVLPVLQSPSLAPPSSWAYLHPRPKGDSHFSLLHLVGSPWIYFHHCTLIESNLHNFPSRSMDWTFCLCIIPDKRSTEINMTWSVPCCSWLCPQEAPASFLRLLLYWAFGSLLHSVSARKAYTEDAAKTAPLHQYLLAAPPACSVNLASDSSSVKLENKRNKLFGCCDEQVVWREWNGQSLVPRIVSTLGTSSMLLH